MPANPSPKSERFDLKYKQERVKVLIAREPWMGDTRVAEVLGVSRDMVSAIRGREFGLKAKLGRTIEEGDPLYFTSEEMARLDAWLATRRLHKE